MPNYLPGYQLVDDPELRTRFEADWKVELPSTIMNLHCGKIPSSHGLSPRTCSTLAHAVPRPLWRGPDATLDRFLVRLFVCYMRPGGGTLDTSLKGLTINVNGRHEC